MTAAGPYDRWPLGRGFERYYGFLGGDTHQYYPELLRDNSQTEPETTPEQGYHLTPDLVEKATAMIADAKQVAPNKPFFLYFASGAMHSPHHLPKELADRYVGKFDTLCAADNSGSLGDNTPLRSTGLREAFDHPLAAGPKLCCS